jgi:cytochrome c peroxidase
VDLDPKRIALGGRLFNDARLSRDNTKSCAACHPLDQGGMDGRRSATSANDSSPARNTPTIFNVGFNASFNWDGIAQTLEAQSRNRAVESKIDEHDLAGAPH